MSTSLSYFKASELAAAVGERLSRGRPSAELRADLEERVRIARANGEVRIVKGRLVRVGE